MSHATSEEIHDHAYGFRLSDHVATCAECGRACEQISAEREVLRDVLEEEIPEVPPELLVPPRPAPRRFSPPALAAAALFLAALAGLLLHRDADRPAAAPALGSQESEIDRLIGELKSSSPVRRKIATLALLKYGGAALEALGHSPTNQDLIDAIRGESEDDRAILARMKQTRLTLKVERGLYTDVARLLEPHVGKIRVDPAGSDFETALLSLNLENVTAYEAVEKISAQLKVPFGVQFGTLVIGKRPEPLASAPVRIAARPADVARRVAELSSDLPATREEASQNLRRMGFGAERALWEALNAASPETQSRAERLLEELYGAVAPPEFAPGDKQAKISIHQADVPLPAVIAEILRQAGDLPLVWDSRVPLNDGHVSFLTGQISPEGALKLLLRPRNINSLSGQGCVLISSREVGTLSTPSPRALWLKPSLAAELETLIADLASSDPARHERATCRLREPDGARGLDASSVLDGLAAASWALEGGALRRCQRLRRTIAAGRQMWYADIPSGAELQALSPAQEALLGARIALPASDALPLEQLLKRDQVRCEFRTRVAPPYRGMGKAPTRWELLKIVLRPEGFDFYMNGDTLVIDTAERVQEAVEK
jgi:hypothetical protein